MNSSPSKDQATQPVYEYPTPDSTFSPFRGFPWNNDPHPKIEYKKLPSPLGKIDYNEEYGNMKVYSDIIDNSANRRAGDRKRKRSDPFLNVACSQNDRSSFHNADWSHGSFVVNTPMNSSTTFEEAIAASGGSSFSSFSTSSSMKSKNATPSRSPVRGICHPEHFVRRLVRGSLHAKKYDDIIPGASDRDSRAAEGKKRVVKCVKDMDTTDYEPLEDETDSEFEEEYEGEADDDFDDFDDLDGGDEDDDEGYEA